MINNGQSTIEDISNEELSQSLQNFHSTTESKQLSQCRNIVISVPTPLTDYQPDLSYVINAAKNTAEILLERTVSILPIRKARYKR